ncbi:MAG: hypothetical protein LBG49_00455 [Mycoplasmataceae bacterium]|jgi:hypothetical protein|nr:hypothetical protein [Mycoplasmataceae bacterium]
MKRILLCEKKTVVGGIGPMMLWTLIIGATMVVSTLANIAHQANQDNNTTSRSNNTSSYYSSTRSRGYLRLSPFPARSAVMFPL